MVTLKRQDFQRDDPLFPVKSPHLKPLGLNRQDLADLAAFLGTLAEPRHRVMPPELPDLENAAAAASR
jgi:cytochrome c peroxidase